MADREIHVCYARLSLSPDRLRSLAGTLSPDERERAARFHLDKHREAFIAGRGVLRSVLSTYTGMAPREIVFRYAARGKPDLPGSLIHFNVSHSGDLAVYALAREPLIGADIERIHEIPDAQAIARRFFSPPEYAELLALRPEQRQVGFFNCWTRKEAYVKAIGDGLSAPLDGFQVSLSPGHPAAFVQIDGSAAKAAEWSLIDLQPESGFAGAVAIHGTGWKVVRAPER